MNTQTVHLKLELLYINTQTVHLKLELLYINTQTTLETWIIIHKYTDCTLKLELLYINTHTVHWNLNYYAHMADEPVQISNHNIPSFFLSSCRFQAAGAVTSTRVHWGRSATWRDWATAPPAPRALRATSAVSSARRSQRRSVQPATTASASPDTRRQTRRQTQTFVHRVSCSLVWLSSVVRVFSLVVRWVVGSILHGVNPLS